MDRKLLGDIIKSCLVHDRAYPLLFNRGGGDHRSSRTTRDNEMRGYIIDEGEQDRGRFYTMNLCSEHPIHYMYSKLQVEPSH